ncbi:MAG: hypothetical protein HYY85_07305 [Deltaproteobacteria bacterium]|nr:hypothetical protein [Deltaproteobacteria bacterium]
MEAGIWLWIIGLALAVGLLALVVRIVRQYEGGVVLRFGQLAGVRGPGLNFIIPLVDQIYRVDLRTVLLDGLRHDRTAARPGERLETA